MKRWLVIDTDSSIDTEISDITITNNNSDTTVQVVTTTVSIGGDEGAKQSSAEVVTVEQRRASFDKHDDDVNVASSSSSSTPLTNPISSSLLSIIGFHDTTTNVEDFLLPLSIEVLTPPSSSSSSLSQERHHSRLPYRFHHISVDVGPNDDDNCDNDEKTIHSGDVNNSWWWKGWTMKRYANRLNVIARDLGIRVACRCHGNKSHVQNVGIENEGDNNQILTNDATFEDGGGRTVYLGEGQAGSEVVLRAAAFAASEAKRLRLQALRCRSHDDDGDGDGNDGDGDKVNVTKMSMVTEYGPPAGIVLINPDPRGPTLGEVLSSTLLTSLLSLCSSGNLDDGDRSTTATGGTIRSIVTRMVLRLLCGSFGYSLRERRRGNIGPLQRAAYIHAHGGIGGRSRLSVFDLMSLRDVPVLIIVTTTGMMERAEEIVTLLHDVGTGIIEGPIALPPRDSFGDYNKDGGSDRELMITPCAEAVKLFLESL